MNIERRSLHPLGNKEAANEILTIIAVTGLSVEARIAGGTTVIGDGLETAAMLRAVLRRGGRGIVSFGVCGGLDPNLRPGQCVIGSSVVSGDEIHLTDWEWSKRLLISLPGSKHAVVAGVDRPIANAQERLDLHARTGAAVADMESHTAARVAAAHKLPFAVCRVVLNPSHRKLPPAAFIKLRSGGLPDLKRILFSVLEQPGQVKHLARLTFDASIAVFALRRGRLLIGPNFAYPDSIQRPAVPVALNSVS